ncbi:hypothetical protein LOTGIDRAFT_168525 [Lottia gigantea]|uniref:Ion transport domain-containing protein n=1 Tax=Lottia gigantea TaxID=225164 RepID=V3ZUQ3_LOTGI|nr:hypothetical protein LOTGIDRAFT_168525 [Lottia gigantea]ESO84661.1 hypothetical protein LOTGIDRAFT_168525 [Lottia gigantea]
MAVASNRALMQYFAKLGQANHDDEYVNLDFIESLLNSGANINCMDKYGQTILHEVARAWHVDVGRFLLEHGADVNKPDAYGRTPLHVASAVDYPEMVNLLIEFKADKESKTLEEEQTPVHYAAKNDACSSLKALAKLGSHEALNQFRSIDRANRKQYVYLNHLVRNQYLHADSEAQSPLLVSVNHRQYQLIMHPVFERLIEVMWSKFGAIGAWKSLILNFVYILLWTVIGVVVEYDDRHNYILPGDWWRILLLICAVGFTMWQVVEELRDYRRSQVSHSKWKSWREREIAKDKKFCHPRWPEEEAFLNRELEMLKEVDQSYFSDMWNVFDWTCYFLLTVCVATHIADVIAHSEHLARWHVRFMSFTIIILWLRLMKNARAFTLLGPFIVMLGHMLKDLLRFVFLYLEFYIPYVCAFWIIFGGDKRAEDDINNPDAGERIVVSGYEYPGQVLFSIFRLTLVDDYDFDNMYLVDSVMATILVWSWLAVSSILCLNLFIALLSDTFQRIYDNAQANSVMQRAITILSFWDSMSKRRKMKFLRYIEAECSPMKDYYDDDLTESGEEDIKKVTIQIKEQLDQIHDSWKFHFGHSLFSNPND